MDITQVYLGQSLRRVQQFLTARAETVGPANASEARRQLDTAIVAFDAAAAEQATARREVRGEVSRRRQLESTLVRRFMTPLTKLARAALVGTPEFAALTPSTSKISRERLVTAARSMATAAEKYGAQLTAAKFAPNFIAQLRAAAEALQASLDASSGKRVMLTGATQRIATVGAQGRKAVAALDATVSQLILGDERLEREWRAARRLRQPAVFGAEETEIAGTIAPISSTMPEVKAA